MRSTITVIWPLWLTWTLILSPSVASAQVSNPAASANDEVARDQGPSRTSSLVGQPAPPLPWIDVIGVEGASAEERIETLQRMAEGKVVFIDFWATWCGFCIKSMPHGLRLQRQAVPDSLVVIFATYLSQRNTKEQVRAFAGHGYEDRYGVEFDGIIAMLDDPNAYSKWLRGGIPRYAVVDQKGIVRYEASGMRASADAVSAAEALASGSQEVPNLATMEQAEQAIEQGRFDEAEAFYRAILTREPGDDLAYNALWQLSRGRSLDKASRPYERARSLLPETFEERETRHFIILSDADPNWVRVQGERLERTYDQFIRFANGFGLRPLPIAHKLVAIAFNDRMAFNKVARWDGVPWPGWIAGYYSPSEDRLVFYHVESDEGLAKERDQLEKKLAEIEAIRRASRRASMVGHRDDAQDIAEGLDELVDAFNEQERHVSFVARQKTITVTVHETVHQLLFHTGVQNRSVRQPIWLSEGLAAAFETDEPSSPFGPAHEYASRRQDFWQLLDNDALLPLRELLISRTTSEATYNQSYALVTWMCRHRRSEFRDFLRRLNAQPPGRPSPETHHGIFEESFGGIDLLEKRWLQFERRND